MDLQTESMNYEAFIRRAFKCDKFAHHADAMNWKNLVDAENGELRPLQLPVSNQFDKVKTALIKATDAFLSMELSNKERQLLQFARENFASAQDSRNLLPFITSLLDLTGRFINFNETK